MIQYGWFVLGMVWWMHTEPCPSCPGIGQLTAAVMLLTAARTALAIVAFRVLFPQGEALAEHEVDEGKKVVAATPIQIAALPVMRFSPKPVSGHDTGGGEDAGCS